MSIDTSKITQKKTGENQYQNSVFREKMLLHCFLSELYKYLWEKGEYNLEVLYSEIDNSGYDILLCVNGETQFVQLKSRSSKNSNPFTINERLADKIDPKIAPKIRACVVLLEIGPEEKTKPEIKYFFYEVIKEKVGGLVNAKKTTLNSEGKRLDRLRFRKLPKKDFTAYSSIEELVKSLFPSLPK